MRLIYTILFSIILFFYRNANGAATLYSNNKATPIDTSKIFSSVIDTPALKKILNDSSLLISIVGKADTSANSKQFPFPGRTSLSDLQQDFFHQFILHRHSEAFKIIFQLKSLTYLNLSDLQLKMLPPGLDSLKNLTALRINYNYLTQIPAEISSLKTLRILMMSVNNIKYIPDDFSWPDSLRILDLSENELQKIPKSLSKTVRLMLVSFRQNSMLSDDSCFKILSEIHSLKTIDISFTSIRTIGHEIGNLKQLTNLYIGGTKIKILPREISQLNNLQEFDLDNLDSLDYNSLKNICELNQLNTLSMNNCNLDSIPFCFQNLKSLTALWLFGNSLHNIPSCICNMPQLEKLVLVSNYLTSFPDCMDNLSNLKVLGIKDNKIDKKSIDALQGKLPNCRIVFDKTE